MRRDICLLLCGT